MKRITFISETNTTYIDLVEETPIQDVLKVLSNDIEHWNNLAITSLKSIIIE
jgi:hypothetical protein